MVFYLIGRLVCHGVGHVYPAYASYKALKAPDSAQELTHWLTYWIVIGLFACVEFVTDIFIFWLPFYNLFKIGVVLWLMLPQTQGATYVYHTVVRPWLIENESKIDGYLHQAQTEAQSQTSFWGQRGAETLRRVAMDSLTKGQAYIVNQADNDSRPSAQIMSSSRIEEIASDGEGHSSAVHYAASSPSTATHLRQRGQTTTDSDSAASALSMNTVANLASAYLGSGLTRLSTSPMSLLNTLNSLMVNNTAISDPEQAAHQAQLIQEQREKLQSLLRELDATEATLRARAPEAVVGCTLTGGSGGASSTATPPVLPPPPPGYMPMPVPVAETPPPVPAPPAEVYPPQTPQRQSSPSDEYDSSDDMVLLGASTMRLPDSPVGTPGHQSGHRPSPGPGQQGSPPAGSDKAGWLW
ncbi:ER membrane protein DP1/Yop1 [Tieghemiomyces parasiticus]|uniref:ER membrane protein DP1/Yop1 n=1 Tax=Tieghemiomyces parasiticus TaxID=78921 RepID=A0A9W8A0A4_9FUNG|nr:ER membrane protein DP1/Yop1 [Tieghemiomyces parasiticus]